MKPNTCLLDLDGTLTDPKAGITGCIQFALEKMGRPAPSKDELEWAIGPPLHQSFFKLLDQDAELAADGVRFYRERFGTIGLFENEVYGGILECLRQLKSAGLILFIATSKPHYYAKQIAEHFGFDHLFKHIHGSEMTGERVHKNDLIQYILETENLDPLRTVMIGDREHDIQGARAHGLKSIGVLYGYGSREELIKAGADELAETPKEITQLILQDPGAESF